MILKDRVHGLVDTLLPTDPASLPLTSQKHRSTGRCSRSPWSTTPATAVRFSTTDIPSKWPTTTKPTPQVSFFFFFFPLQWYCCMNIFWCGSPAHLHSRISFVFCCRCRRKAIGIGPDGSVADNRSRFCKGSQDTAKMRHPAGSAQMGLVLVTVLVLSGARDSPQTKDLRFLFFCHLNYCCMKMTCFAFAYAGLLSGFLKNIYISIYIIEHLYKFVPFPFFCLQSVLFPFKPI